MRQLTSFFQALVCLTIFFWISDVSAQKQGEKPNILVFISDDQSQIDVGCYGNQDVQTPHMDQLAREGMRFTSAYAASPMCSPSRSNMFTGLYPFRNGSQMNHFALRPGTKTLPDYLKNLGYQVTIAGKVDVYPQPEFNHVGSYFGKYLPASNRNDPRDSTTHYIKEYFNQDKHKPLCLVVSTWLPHVPWSEGKSFNPEKIKVPEYMVDTPETRKALAAYYQSISKADQMLGKVLTALEDAGEKENTVVIFVSDQGTQFPGAKWTTYDQGLHVPLIVRWPKNVKPGSVSDALISLTDLTPTLIDLAGGEEEETLDGKSFVNVMLGNQQEHHDFILGETSMEPHYWYNYVPSRTIITKDGLHYIKNYHPGVRFITHIDKVEQNMYYFDSWQRKARQDADASFLLDRYSFRPPEELYDLKKDRWELNNLAMNDTYHSRKNKLQNLLHVVLDEQGETEEMIMHGTLPDFLDQAYQISQGISVSDLSLDKTKWNPDTLILTAYLEGMNQNGAICQYFNQFEVWVHDQKLEVLFRDQQVFTSKSLESTSGQLVLTLTENGFLQVRFANEMVLEADLHQDFTKIQPGYVSSGLIRGAPLSERPIEAFGGRIYDLRISMDHLSREPR